MEKKLQKIYYNITYYNLLIAIYKYCHDDKKCETCRIEYKYCDFFPEYTNFKDDLIECKCLCCKKNYQQKFDEKLKERFINKYKFSNHDNNKFILLLFNILKNYMNFIMIYHFYFKE